jgi:cytochrome P450
LSEDDEYKGYKIPAGTVVTYNHWAISNSPDEYEQPERFWPERFINDELDKPAKGHLGFGAGEQIHGRRLFSYDWPSSCNAGRRVCVGYNVAVSNMFIALARLIYCFDFEPVPGALIDVSKPLKPSFEGPSFQVKIKVRSEAHRQLIERECKDAAVVAWAMARWSARL